jgi:hypothetical protein
MTCILDDVYEHVSTLLVETTERIHGPPKEDTNVRKILRLV